MRGRLFRRNVKADVVKKQEWHSMSGRLTVDCRTRVLIFDARSPWCAGSREGMIQDRIGQAEAVAGRLSD